MRKIIKYLIFTFLTAWALDVIVSHDYHLGTFGGSVGLSQCLMLRMCMPALGALFARANFREMGWEPDFRQNRNAFLFAWLSPTVLQLAGAILYFLVFPSDFDISGSLLETYRPDEWSELQAGGGSYFGYILRSLVFSVISFRCIFGIFLGLGEEIGWRGFLYPELHRRFGRTRAVLIGGIIHGVWHFPLILLIGYEYGRDYIGAPALGLFVFCIFTVSTGIISYHLYEKTNCIWLPALIHGAVNAVFNPYIFGGAEHPERRIFGPADVGLIAVIPTALLAARLLYLDYKAENTEYIAVE